MFQFFVISAISLPLSLVYSGDLNSENDSLYTPISGRASTYFIQNKGQISTTQGLPADFVKFVYKHRDVHIFLLNPPAVAFQFLQRDTVEESPGTGRGERLEMYRMDLILEGANAQAEISAEGKSTDYQIYYTPSATFVHHFKTIIYKNVYPNIDWKLHITEQGLIKHEFLVRPGGNPAQIKLKSVGHEYIRIDKEGGLEYGNRLGLVKEAAPVSFQNGKKIPTSFLLNGDQITFKISGYDKKKELLIDPTIFLASYFGGNQRDEIHSIATDLGSVEGIFYIAGFTNSLNLIGATTGHQVTNGGGRDAFLSKLNGYQQVLWTTFYGGNSTDEGYACAIDSAGNVYLAGTTFSTNNIASTNAFQITKSTGADGFLAKFDPSGVRLWGTYFGGAGDDQIYGVVTDADLNVYVAGRTTSQNLAHNGHQNLYGGGISDAFLAKFNETGQRLWCTYYGGAGEDDARGVAIDGDNMVYIAGSTGSASNIASPGAHQTQFGGGGFDAYLAKFDTSGARLWATYYGGNGLDMGKRVKIGPANAIYITGATSSTSGIASPNGFQTSIGGGLSDAFLVRFNASGNRVWGTYYGGQSIDEGNDCAVDPYGNIWLAGSTTSMQGISMHGYQNNHAGGYDAFLVRFSAAGQRWWATYYGGPMNDLGLASGFNSLGKGILGGFTFSSTGISTGPPFPTYQGNVDGFTALFSPCNGTKTGSDSAEGCIHQPLSPIVFNTVGATGAGLAIGLPDGVYPIFYPATNQIHISGTPTQSGTFNYQVFLGSACGQAVLKGTIVVKPEPSAVVSPNNPILCVGQPISPGIIIPVPDGMAMGTPQNIPQGVNVLFNANTSQISITGTPLQSGVFMYQIPVITPCGTVNASGTLHILPQNVVQLLSAPSTANQTVCSGTPIDTIVYFQTVATGIGTPLGLPDGVSAVFDNFLIKIFGIPTQKGVFKFVVPLTGGCGTAAVMGDLTVISCSTDLPEIDENDDFKVFPNPNSGKFRIKSLSADRIEIIDMTGRMLGSFYVEEGETEVNFSLQAGLYILKKNSTGEVRRLVVN